jgi:flagellar biosynthesis/type III secretory pathway protein FliH
MKLKEMDQQNELEIAENKGFQKGLNTGIEKGFQKGLNTGIEKAKLEVAKNLLDVLDDETIAQKTY